MRAITFGLGLVLIFLIPGERFVHFEGIGTISRVVGMVVAAAWLLSVVGSGLRKPKLFHGIVALFVLWNALSIFWSVNPDDSIVMIGTYFRVSVLAIIVWDLYRTADTVRIALQAFVLGGLIPSFSTVLSYARGGVINDYDRFMAAGSNMNSTAFILALTVPIALYLAIEADTFGNRWIRMLRLVNFACVLLAVYAIGLTATRFAVLMIVPAGAYGLWKLIQSGRVSGIVTVSALLVSVIGVVQFLPQGSIDRLASTQREVSVGDLNGRTVVWKLGLESWANHPLLGIGAAASGEPSVPVFGHPKAMHNSFIAILVELGLVGICLMCAILVIALAHAWQMERAASIFWLTVLAVWLLGNMPLTAFHTKETWLLLSLLVSYPAAKQMSDLSPQHEVELAA